MNTLHLPGADLTCSKFIFGTASLFNVGTKKRRIALLEAAVDNGFTHFDTAPYYGFGMAERDLSHVLAAHPHLTVTTKVGIYAPGGEDQPSLSILLRKAAGRAISAISLPTINFHLVAARAALESSLRRLKRERIDIYMLHEPRTELLATDEWQAWLEDCVAAGKIGTFGLAATAQQVEGFLKRAPGLTRVLQLFDSLDKKEADILRRYDKPLQITFGYVSAALSRGCGLSVEEILQQSMERNSDGAIIVSTRRRERLAQYAELAGTRHS